MDCTFERCTKQNETWLMTSRLHETWLLTHKTPWSRLPLTRFSSPSPPPPLPLLSWHSVAIYISKNIRNVQNWPPVDGCEPRSARLCSRAERSSHSIAPCHQSSGTRPCALEVQQMDDAFGATMTSNVWVKFVTIYVTSNYVVVLAG